MSSSTKIVDLASFIEDQGRFVFPSHVQSLLYQVHTPIYLSDFLPLFFRFQLSKALCALDAKGKAHGSLSPQNILLRIDSSSNNPEFFQVFDA